MITDSSIQIDAPAPLVWQIFSDVERWPEMTPSVDRLTALDEAPLAVGRRYRIEQPRFPKLVWEVTEVEPGRSWTWVQRSPGGTTLAIHEVVAQGPERTLVRQRIDQRGPIGAVVGFLTKRITPRYMEQEAQGLKAMAEAAHRRDAASA